MDTRLLRNFMAIIDCGSLSKAAKRLHVAQPALSIQVAGLETELGVRLVHRSSQGVAPTKAGLTLYRHARAILDQVESARDALRHGGEAEAGPVAVGLPTSMASVLAAPLLQRVLARHPAIRLRIFESMSGYIADRLSGGLLDLALLFRDANTLGVAAMPLLDEELFLMGDAGVEDLPRNAPCPVSRLSGVPLAMPSDSQGLRVLVERSFVKADAVLHVAADVDSLPTLVNAARMGLACVILSRSALVSHGGEQGLSIRRLTGPPLTRPVSLCWPTNLPRTAATMAVQHTMVELMHELVAQGVWAGAVPRWPCGVPEEKP